MKCVWINVLNFLNIELIMLWEIKQYVELGTVSQMNQSIISKNKTVKMASLHLLAFQRFKDFKDSPLFSEQSSIFELS